MNDSSLALQRLYHLETTKSDAPAFTQPMGGGVVREFSYKQALDETRRMAAYLKGLNLPPQSKIAILSKNCAHWIMTDWAIWMAGHVSVPLYPTLAAETVRQILEHSESKLLFVGKLDGWEEMRPGVPKDLPCISYPLSPKNDFPTWDKLIAGQAPLNGSPLRPATDVCTIMYTSGTTGVPKGVTHTFGTFAYSLEAGLKRIRTQPENRMLSYLPLAHVAERTLVEHGQLALAFHVFFAESLETFAADLKRARPTVFFSVPRLWVKFQQGVHGKIPAKRLSLLLKIPIVSSLIRKKILEGLGLDKVVYAAGGAAPMPPSLLQWYADLGLPIVEVYGMTENCGISHSTLPGTFRPGMIGLPYEGVQSRLDPTTGEIQVKTGGVMVGYYKEPELTRQTFTEDGWLHTGDKGELAPDGYLRITGRVKDLFKTSKGKYVAPAPIEDRLVMNPSVEACLVAGANLSQPIGIVMLNADAVKQAHDSSGRQVIEQSLQAHLDAVNAALDPHERMEHIVVETTAWTVENGLITPTLKVKRNKLEEIYGPHLEAWSSANQRVIWRSPN